jgi:hypothetical protein
MRTHFIMEFHVLAHDAMQMAFISDQQMIQARYSVAICGKIRSGARRPIFAIKIYQGGQSQGCGGQKVNPR